jgi:hypothetical protein
MSCTIHSIPGNAYIVKSVTGTVNPSSSADHAGKTMTVRLYQAGNVQYVTVKIDGEKMGNYGRTTWAKQFSGRNLKYAEEFYQANAEDVLTNR